MAQSPPADHEEGGVGAVGGEDVEHLRRELRVGGGGRWTGAGAPAPAEILLVDQSGADGVAAMVRGLGDGPVSVRVVTSPRRGIALAMNTCLSEGAHDRVAI